jgi:hypothetical protein
VAVNIKALSYVVTVVMALGKVYSAGFSQQLLLLFSAKSHEKNHSKNASSNYSNSSCQANREPFIF